MKLSIASAGRSRKRINEPPRRNPTEGGARHLVMPECFYRASTNGFPPKVPLYGMPKGGTCGNDAATCGAAGNSTRRD